MSEREASVYYAFCEHGGLLYVGVAYDVTSRIKQHRATKPWWGTVDHVLAYLYPTRREALAVEAHAIHNLRPMHNLTGQVGCGVALPHEVAPHSAMKFDVHRANGVRVS